ncbi:hypothetical protein CERZMDRAFT_97747 [Cercospora zeae-maydis SCOH1-5]|uniref:Uncharacterized protein n=1 Tax=Cercospora zeae-maydis SCOH1-5 TaxID=717836 RepID=A0A6A6FGH4_9PEZI|nr:hypothetical protein CERZMDRAFT_97747 [Cercospora zeae-maydis SCOH1-5]
MSENGRTGSIVDCGVACRVARVFFNIWTSVEQLPTLSTQSMKQSSAGTPAMDILTAQYTPTRHEERLRSHSPGSSLFFAWRGRKKKSRPRQAAAHCNEYGVEPGDRSSTERSSSSHEIGTPRSLPTAESGYHFRLRSPDAQELSGRLAALTQSDASQRASQDTTRTTTSTTSSDSHSSRSWCLQSCSPLRNQAAGLNLSYQPRYRDHSNESCLRRVNGQTVTAATSITSPSLPSHSRAITPSPLSVTFDNSRVQNSPTLVHKLSIQDNDFAPLPTTTTTLVIVDAEAFLTKLHQTETLLSKEYPVSIRCRAISKCVWREWRGLLYKLQESEMSTDELIHALVSTFEKSIVDYGWETNWTELDEGFVKVMQKIAESVGTSNFAAADETSGTIGWQGDSDS